LKAGKKKSAKAAASGIGSTDAMPFKKVREEALHNVIGFFGFIPEAAGSFPKRAPVGGTKIFKSLDGLR